MSLRLIKYLCFYINFILFLFEVFFSFAIEFGCYSKLGLLINFNVALIKNGIRRVVNNF